MEARKDDLEDRLSHLPDEILLLLLLNCGQIDLLNLFATSKKLRNLANDDSLWKNRFKQHFPHLLPYVEIHKEANVSWFELFQKYFEIELGHLTPDEKNLFIAAKEGNLPLFQKLIETMTADSLLEIKDRRSLTIFSWAIINGHANVSSHLLNKTPKEENPSVKNIYWRTLCQQEINNELENIANVETLLADERTISEILYDTLEFACQNGLVEHVKCLFDFILSQLAKNSSLNKALNIVIERLKKTDDFDRLLRSVIKNDQLDILKLFVDFADFFPFTNSNSMATNILMVVIRLNNLDLAKKWFDFTKSLLSFSAHNGYEENLFHILCCEKNNNNDDDGLVYYKNIISEASLIKDILDKFESQVKQQPELTKAVQMQSIRNFIPVNILVLRNQNTPHYKETITLLANFFLKEGHYEDSLPYLIKALKNAVLRSNLFMSNLLMQKLTISNDPFYKKDALELAFIYQAMDEIFILMNHNAHTALDLTELLKKLKDPDHKENIISHKEACDAVTRGLALLHGKAEVNNNLLFAPTISMTANQEFLTASQKSPKNFKALLRTRFEQEKLSSETFNLFCSLDIVQQTFQKEELVELHAFVIKQMEADNEAHVKIHF